MPHVYVAADAQGREFLRVPMVEQPCAEPGCGRTVVVGLPFCDAHLPLRRRVCVRPSTIPDAGNGLYACDPSAPPGAVLFRTGEAIGALDARDVPLMTKEVYELYRRHGVHPEYAIQTRDGVRDFASYRHYLMLANRPPRGGKANARFTDATGHAVRMVASAPIRNGSEIFVSYNLNARRPPARGSIEHTRKRARSPEAYIVISD